MKVAKFRIDSDLRSVGDAKARLRELHEFLVNTKARGVMTTLNVETATWDLIFEISTKDKTRSARIKAKFKALDTKPGNGLRPQYEVTASCVDQKLDIHTVCREMYDRSAKDVLTDMLGNVMMQATPRREPETPIRKVPFGNLLELGTADNSPPHEVNGIFVDTDGNPLVTQGTVRM